MSAWERDLKLDWDLDSWSIVFSRAYKGILNVALIEANLKVLSRWYLTPAKLSIMYPSSEAICFRGCGLFGSMAHIWWECPKIRRYWNKICNLIYKVSGLQISRSPEVALLNIHDPKIPKISRSLIHFILLGAKSTLAKAWKQPKASFMAAKRKISWIMTQEKVSSILLDSRDKFENIWEPWPIM